MKSIEQEHSNIFRKREKELNEKITSFKQEAESTIAKLLKDNKSLKSQLDVEVSNFLNYFNHGSGQFLILLIPMPNLPWAFVDQ